MTPFIKTDKEAGCVYTLPCGKCPTCAKRRISGWSFRLLQEEKVSSSAHFLTLTYDSRHIPITKNGYTSLDKTDVQKFMKRLRKTHSQKLSYYCVGEYGSITKRPHYHILLFNARQDLIQPAWQLGEIHYGNVTGASVGYSLKYMSKPRTNFDRSKDDRNPEFALMSKGLGKSYITPAMKKWHKADLENRMYHTIDDGKKISMTRYMKDKIYDEDEREQIANATRLKNTTDNPIPEQAKFNAFKQMAHLSKTQKQKL